MLAWFSSMKVIKGDVVLITGGAMGIGRCMALRFAALGAIVVIWDLNVALGEHVVAEIAAIEGAERARFLQVDVTDRQRVYAVGREVVSMFGAVDILVNNAGIVHGAPILSSSDDMIERTMNVNALAHFWTIKAFLPTMAERNSGHIVAIASVAGIFGGPGLIDYAMSKAAVIGLMTSLRQELSGMSKNGVRTTLVCPSFIDTGMLKGASPPRMTTWLQPDDVAEQIVNAVRRNQWRLLLPTRLSLLEIIMALSPDWLVQTLVRLSRVTHSMDQFEQTRQSTTVQSAC